jgi:two-component system response regulator AtoC
MSIPTPTVLVIDDDRSMLTVITALLRRRSLDVIAAPSASEGLDVLARRDVQLVITDLRMPETDGMDVLVHLRRDYPQVPVVVLTAHGSVPVAVEAMRRGASDFVQKPFDREDLWRAVDGALAHAPQRDDGAATSALLGRSHSMRELAALLTRAARGSATVLLRGETGTGKELAARRLHELSPRASGPFVRIHCAALPDGLLESELFGHEPGAFTGAVRRKPGRVELAQGGSLFLDEIGDVSAAVQVKLLQLLQEREFSRLGGVETLRADVRIVAATNRDLDAMVAAGHFRADLFYRLNVVPIWCPPLRDRPGDVELLARSFVAELSRANQRDGLGLSGEAVALLAAQPWPGNVRQLRNLIERLVVLSEGDEIGADEAAREISRSESSPPPHEQATVGARLEERRRFAERTALDEALRLSGGNRALAARILGVSRRTLYNMLERRR